MAGELKIKPGTRLAIAFDAPLGKQPEFDMVSTFAKALDESAFLISIPMKGGKPLAMDESQKLLIRYGHGEDTMIVAGYPDDTVKEGIRRYWRIRRVTEQRAFFKRADERLKVALKVEYMQDTWPVNYDGVVEKEEGMTLDISAGGLAMYLNRHFDVGETILVDLPRVGVTPAGQAIPEVVAVVCWQRETLKGSLYRHICGLQFRLGDGDKGRLKDYCGNIKRRYKL